MKTNIFFIGLLLTQLISCGGSGGDNSAESEQCTVNSNSGSITSSNIANIQLSCNIVYSFSGNNISYNPNISEIAAGNSARTYNVWAKIDPSTYTSGFLISQGSLSSYEGSQLGLSTTASQPVSFNNGTGNFYMYFDVWVGGVWSSKFTLNDSNWHMYSVVFDPNAGSLGVSLYMDGNLLPTPIANPTNGFTPSSVDTVNYNNSVILGGESFNGSTPYLNSGFVGDLKSVSAWSNALTSAQISALYFNGTRPSSGLFFTTN
jgi:hypothetical protein